MSKVSGNLLTRIKKWIFFNITLYVLMFVFVTVVISNGYDSFNAMVRYRCAFMRNFVSRPFDGV